ncbi:histidine phosphatase family protein [Paenibacillus marinisediminis]
MKRRILLSFLVGILLVTAMGCSTSTNESLEGKEKKPVEIYLTRHGKTMLNTTDRVQGWADAPLTEKGIEVAEYLGKGLKDIDFERAYSSDSGRAIETAKIVLDKSGQKDLELVQNKDLREACFGEFEGELNETFHAKLAEANNMSMDEFMEVFDVGIMLDTAAKMDTSKMAETSEDVSNRLKSAIDQIAKDTYENGGGEVLVVSHGISIMSLLYAIDPGALDELEAGLENASISKIVYDNGKYTVESVNDMSYVEKGKNEK